MKIIEAGLSVAYRVLNGHNNGKTKTYVCVPEDTQKPLMHLFKEMQEEVIGLSNIDSIDEDRLTVISKNKQITYTLSHEVIIDNNFNKTVLPSNLLRYLYSRVFSIETLYIGDHNEIIDLRDASTDAVNRNLVPITNYKNLLIGDYNTLLTTLDLWYLKNYRPSTQVEDILYETIPYLVEPINSDNKMFKYILESIDTSLLKNKIGGYPFLDVYFNKVCGLKFEVVFKPEQNFIKKREELIKSIIDNKKRGVVETKTNTKKFSSEKILSKLKYPDSRNVNPIKYIDGLDKIGTPTNNSEGIYAQIKKHADNMQDPMRQKSYWQDAANKGILKREELKK